MHDFASARELMIETQLRGRGISDERILAAMSRVPRERFVSESFRAEAYEDHPLPIGAGQTISQPYIVALMLEALGLSPQDKALEIGTGSGYATALLAELAAQVFSVERHPTLADNARQTLAELGYTNVKLFAGDGSLGIPSAAPFNAILVSAAAPEIPGPLLAQLADGGRMIIPVGRDDSQQLQFVRKVNGQLIVSRGELVRFVPLISERS